MIYIINTKKTFMRSTFLIFLISISFNNFIYASQAKTVSAHINNPATEFNVAEENMLRNYEAFLAKLPSGEPESVMKAITHFTQIFSNQPADVCDSAYVYFDQFYNTVLEKLNENHQFDATSSDSSGAGKQKTFEVLYQKLQENGFSISWEEGMTYVVRNYAKITAAFAPFVSKAMRQYLEQSDKANMEGFASDASISITPIQFVDRILWYEQFNAKNKKFILRQRCIDDYKFYLAVLCIGTDNTPLHEYDAPKKLTDFYKQAYSYLLAKYSRYYTAKVLKPYIKALNKQQVQKAEKILQGMKKRKVIAFTY